MRFAFAHAGAVVPGYHLVWYNTPGSIDCRMCAVVPGYHLVWYNYAMSIGGKVKAVVPGYHLVWYNEKGAE